ncbi:MULTISPECIES: hypothetical protein [Streptomyces]|uniref:RdlA protein n=1 Tax=Streptomyces triticiradicis TaxID=2651189 RepID=A0A7J5DJL9_9ACTN|nr:hypothetical protein [Streptomyces triticiradicis]KAB1988851.1 hypothetical protein F8144_09870 [Streptomyces triticiradicis]
MRKLQHVALVVAAAGGLSVIGAGSSFAAAPNGAVQPSVSQSGAQAAAASSAQATTQGYGSSAPLQAAPQRTAEVAPQVSPQLSPQLSPDFSPRAPQAGQSAQLSQTNLFRPYQECSPQTLISANVPVALLGHSENKGVECTQINRQVNSLANAQAQ